MFWVGRKKSNHFWIRTLICKFHFRLKIVYHIKREIYYDNKSLSSLTCGFSFVVKGKQHKQVKQLNILTDFSICAAFKWKPKNWFKNACSVRIRVRILSKQLSKIYYLKGRK